MFQILKIIIFLITETENWKFSRKIKGKKRWEPPKSKKNDLHKRGG